MSSEPLCEFDLQKNEQLFPPTSPCFANDSNGEVTEAAVFCRIPKYLFVELTSLDELSFPTSSSRIKYTCISASPHYLAVGSTSGTVYLFSRYASKYRARLSSVPVKVVSTKDGAVTRLAVSPDEKYLAVANQKGPVTITSLTNDGHSSALLVTNNCHVGTDNDGITNHVTEFCWSSDSSRLYAGDRKGQVSCTRVQGRYLFRSSCEVLWETDSEIVQMDLDGSTLLVSTLTRSCLCDLETLSCVQVGKKLRNGRMGAVFYRTQPPSFGNKQSNGVNDKSRGRKETVSLKLVFASRPNGRLWEANGLGVVYSTHQHRNLKNILYHPVVSFKRTFALEESSREDISRRLNYGKLYFIDCENKRLLLSQNGPSFSLVDPMDGSLLLTSDLKIDDCEIDCCVCGSDIFSLCREDGSLRKLSLFTFRKAVEKLYLRRCFAQVAQIISFYAKEINDVEDIPWNCDIIENIVDYVEQLDCTTLSDNCLQTSDVTRLKSVADAMKQQKKDSHLRCESPRKPSFIIRKLENGIHRVVRIMEYSGYEDDFTFRAPSPLRSRSKSTPNMESPLTNLKPNSWKQRSLPVSHENLGDAVYEGTGENIETPSDQRKALIQKAMKLLSENRETRSKLLRDGGNIDSLETILSSNEKHVEFESQVTVGDVPKDLEVAVKVLRFITDKRLDADKAKIDGYDFGRDPNFSSLFGRPDPLAGLEILDLYPELSQAVHVQRIQRKRAKGARIIKAIKPRGKVATEEHDEANEKTHETKIPESDVNVNWKRKSDNGETKKETTVPSGTVIMNDEMSDDMIRMIKKGSTENADKGVQSELFQELRQKAVDSKLEHNAADLECRTLKSITSVPSQCSSTTQDIVENNVVTPSTTNITGEMKATKDDRTDAQEKDSSLGLNSPDSAFGPKLTPKLSSLMQSPKHDEPEEADFNDIRMDASAVTAAPSTVSSAVDVGPNSDPTSPLFAGCSQCHLHRTWNIISLFGPAMSRMKLMKDYFSDGGVPYSTDQWLILFSLYMYRKERSRNQSLKERMQLCANCARVFQFSSRMEEKLVSLKQCYTRAMSRPDDENGRKMVRETCLAMNDDEVKKLFFSKKIPVPDILNSSVKSPLVDNDSPSVAYHSVVRTPELTSNPGAQLMLTSSSERWSAMTNESESTRFPWLTSVTLSQLLYCLSLCHGVGAIFDVLRENKSVLHALDDDDWRWLAVMKACDAERWKGVMPKEVVDSMLCELDITCIEDVGPNVFESSKDSSSQDNISVQPQISTIISLDRNCPCCTLPLKTDVSDVERYITVFPCGHGFHEVCLCEANATRCLKCELDRRRRSHQSMVGKRGAAVLSTNRHPANDKCVVNFTIHHIPSRAAQSKFSSRNIQRMPR